MALIDISKLDKAKVLAGLYNHSHPQGMGFLHYDPKPMTVEEAREILIRAKEFGYYFDYVKGRVLKVDLSGDILDTRLYDRDNGEGAGEKVVKGLFGLPKRMIRLE